MAGPAIPVENVYYLLCYAWDKLAEAQLTDVSLKPEARLQDLFGLVLKGGVTHLLKRGIDRSYLPVDEELAGVRGRIDVATSLKRITFARARAHCVFDELSPDVLHNRIIKTTLRQLASTAGLDRSLAESLRDLYRRMPNVREITLTGQSFRRVTLGRNTAYYAFLLNVCEIVYQNLLVHEATGQTIFRDFTRDDKQMAALFERFLFRFYRHEQREYRVKNPQLTWHATGDNESVSLLPIMRTDIVLANASRTIVIDAKYYAKALGDHWSKSSIRSGHLYQIFSYLSHIALDTRRKQVCGALIYPRTTASMRARVELFNYPFIAATINLAQPWQQIHSDLLAIVSDIEAIAA